MVTVHLLDCVEKNEADRVPGLMFWDQVLQMLDILLVFLWYLHSANSWEWLTKITIQFILTIFHEHSY